MPSDPPGGPTVLHASAVALSDRAALIRGAPGSGKSRLALQAMALGARLVADDRVVARPDAGGIELSAPNRIRGLIEARGIGILRVPDVAGTARLAWIVDLDRNETERLPKPRATDLLGQRVPVIFGAARHDLAAVLIMLLGGGELMPPDEGFDADR